MKPTLNPCTNRKYTNEDLKTMQEWPLERKIQVTQLRIMEWYMRWEEKVYISFSGGKDSTVLLDLARRIYPNIVAVFIDTGLEYPEVRKFALSKENVIRITPKIPFNKVIEQYGYPVISKEVSGAICGTRSKPNGYEAQKFDEESDYIKKYGKRYYLGRYKYLLDSDIKISGACCNQLKKYPVKKFEKLSGLMPILATMADESVKRKTEWLTSGCNAFENKRPISAPMSFWTDQDVLKYLDTYSIQYSSVYGEIVQVDGKYKTTGEYRTGCMFCMFGCHLDKYPNKFQRMKISHPRQWEFCIRGGEVDERGVWVPTKDGLGLGRVLDYIGVPYE